jgi:hypothetical protein
MEPITTLIVTAAALGAAAGLKPTAEQAIKDAYAAFKRIISDHYGDYRDFIDSFDFLNKKPEDPDRQAAFKNELTNVGVADDPALIEAAKTLLASAEAHSPASFAAIGMDIEVLRAAVLEAENVQAGKSGTSVRIKTANIEGTASFKNIGGKQSVPDPN